jgi:hypothetical protein
MQIFGHEGTDQDIVKRIRKRFPHPKDAEDGLLSNEAAREIEALRGFILMLHINYNFVPKPE